MDENDLGYLKAHVETLFDLADRLFIGCADQRIDFLEWIKEEYLKDLEE